MNAREFGPRGLDCVRGGQSGMTSSSIALWLNDEDADQALRGRRLGALSADATALVVSGESFLGMNDEGRFADVRARESIVICDSRDGGPSSLLTCRMWRRFPEIQGYQLVQVGRGQYLLRLKPQLSAEPRNALVMETTESLGAASDINREVTGVALVYSSGTCRSAASHYDPEGVTEH